MTRLYAIGDRRNGILFIRTNPRRIVHIPVDQIESYAREAGCSVESVFEDIASAFGATPGARFASVEEIAGSGWDVSRFFTMPAGEAAPELCAASEAGDSGWDVSRFFTMPAGSEGEFHAVSEVEGGAWDVSRFFTMPARSEGAFHAVAEVKGGAWDVSRFFTMPAGAAAAGEAAHKH